MNINQEADKETWGKQQKRSQYGPDINEMKKKLIFSIKEGIGKTNKTISRRRNQNAILGRHAKTMIVNRGKAY